MKYSHSNNHFTMPPIDSKNYKPSELSSSSRLQYIGDKKLQKSAMFFRDTRVSSCSYISQKGGVPSAVPFYSSPTKTYADSMTKSTYLNSLNQ